MKPNRVMQMALTLLVLIFGPTSSLAMPIFIDAGPGLETLEPTWILSGFPLQIEVESNNTIGEVKVIINSLESSIVISNQILFLDSLELNGAWTLADYNIQKNDHLQLASNRVSAVPEPGTLTLLGLGLASIGFAKRKKA